MLPSFENVINWVENITNLTEASAKKDKELIKWLTATKMDLEELITPYLKNLDISELIKE